MSKRNLFFVIIFFYNLKVLAASSYPTAIVNRVFGSNQDVGSCQSEAYVGAVEHKLAEIGAPVRLSLQYTHPYVWRNNSVEEAAKSGANVTPETLRIVSQFGGIVPEFFLPEDLEGTDQSSLRTNMYNGDRGVRPSIENMGIFLQDFSAQEVGFSDQQYIFSSNFSNSRTYQDFLQAVYSGQVVTLSFDAQFLYSFDPLTGMLKEPYKKNDEDMALANHSVAVVGYDDELGGFIIRNTWNDKEAQNAVDYFNVNHEATDEQKESLKRFRMKISRRILPGYYLFPYQYVHDMASKQVGGFRVLNGNWGAFANQFANLANRFQIIKTFYTCNYDLMKKSVIQFNKQNQIINNPNLSDERKKMAYQKQMTIVYNQISRKNLTLNYGKFSKLVDGSIDKTVDFYNGDFAWYYCGVQNNLTMISNPKEIFWPVKGRDKILENPKFHELENKLSKNYVDIESWFQMFELLAQEVNK